MSRQSPVSEFMTTDVLTLDPDMTVAEAMTTMLDLRIDGAPVVEGRNVVGMLSTGDLIVAESKLRFPTIISLFGATLELPGAKKDFEEDLRRALGSTVRDLMHREPVTIGEEETIERAATLLHQHDVSRVPVVGQQGLVGIISRVDIIREILGDLSA